jgi:hypothetical protein
MQSKLVTFETKKVQAVVNPWFHGLKGDKERVIGTEGPCAVVAIDERVWVLSQDGLRDLENQQWLPLDRAYSGVCYSGGRLWLSDGNRVNCYQIEADELKFLFETRLQRARLHRKHKVSIVTEGDNLVVFAVSKLICLKITETLEVKNCLQMDFRITHMAAYDGVIYAVTRNGALYTINKNKVALLVQKTGIFTGVAVDEHCIYLCSYSGQKIEVLRRTDGELIRQWPTQACGTSLFLHKESLYVCIAHRNLIQVFSR